MQTKRFCSVLATALFSGLLFTTARAQTYNSWTNTSVGFWSTPSNWSAGAPSNNFSAFYISNAAAKTVTILSALPVSTLTISNLTLAGAGGSVNALAVADVSAQEKNA